MRARCSVLIGVSLIALPSLAQDGSASLTGTVKDITGADVSSTLAELRSERASASGFRTSADFAGIYNFSGLPPDEYSLKLSSPGFYLLTVKSIHILDGEQKSLPTLQLSVGGPGCNGGPPSDYIRILPVADHIGNLGGSVRLDRGPMVAMSPPIAGADVTVMCSTGKVCGATKTDSKGQYLFKALAPGIVSVRVNRAGFYPMDKPGYSIQEGLESIYFSIYIERCPLGNCDPRLRPKRPLATCE